MLEPVALRCVVVDVVGCDHRGARLVCQGREAAVARRIAPKEVALELDVHGARAEPLHVASEQVRRLPTPAVERQVGQPPPASSGQQDHAAGVIGQVGRIEPGVPSVGGVGQGHQARDVGIALPRAGQQDDVRAVGQGQLATGDGPDAEAASEPCEVQGAAQVRVGQRQRPTAVIGGPFQQLVDVRCSLAEGVEARGVKLDVACGHAGTV